MKSVATASLIVVIYYFHFHDVTKAQNLDYPNRFYVPLKFDWAVRGAFNVSECLEELLTCWELIRPFFMCTQNRMKDSLCSNMRDYCHDEHGDFPVTWFHFDLTEQTCRLHLDNEQS